MKFFSVKSGSRNILNKAIILLLIHFVLLWASSLYAGPFLKIDRVDSESEFPKIKLYLTVRNTDNTTIAGLNEENILLYEDGYRVNYVRVKNLSETDGFLYLVFSIDSSKSISRELLKQIKRSAGDILNNTGSNDYIAIYRFNDKVELMNNFTNNRVELLKNIKKIERHGKETLLYNAIYDSIDLLNKVEISRKAVIVFTDGKDEGSSVEIDDIIKFARDSHIPVYFICLKSFERRKILARISKLTGGRLYIPKNGNLKDVYKTIVRTIKNQYIVDYQSILEPDGQIHKMEVRLKYGAIRDRDQKDIAVKKSLDFIHLPTISEILLIALIFILVGLLIFFLVYTLRRLNKIIIPPQALTETTDASPSSSIGQNEKIKSQGEGIPYPGDEELIYSKTWLVERDGKEPDNKIPILADEFSFGRDKNNSIVIEGKSVSSMHAKIKRVKNSYYLFDMASDNGTYLNENKLLRPKLLYDWDEIRIGKKIFIFRGSNIA